MGSKDLIKHLKILIDTLESDKWDCDDYKIETNNMVVSDILLYKNINIQVKLRPNKWGASVDDYG